MLAITEARWNRRILWEIPAETELQDKNRDMGPDGRKFRLLIDIERCKGCLLCISVCPRAVIKLTNKLNSKGQHYVEVIRPAACIGCIQCAVICPDAAIEIVEED